MKTSIISRPIFSITFLATALTFSSGIAHASLCSGPSNNTERTICANPQLKQIEEVISKSYFEKRAELSPMEQQEIERDQKLWYSFLKNCKTDENCIRDAFNQRLTDIQDFNQVAEKEGSENDSIEDDSTDVANTDDTDKTDLGSHEPVVNAQNSPADRDDDTGTAAEQATQTKQSAEAPSLVTRFTNWLFPNKDSSSDAEQAQDVATQQTVPEKPVSDMETASSGQQAVNPTEVMPSEQTIETDTQTSDTDHKTTGQAAAKKDDAATKLDSVKTSIATATKKVTAAKEFIPALPVKATPKNTVQKTEPEQAIASGAKPGTANKTIETAPETKTADKAATSATLFGKIKSFFSSNDPADSTKSPEKEIAKGTLGNTVGTEKEAGNSDLTGSDLTGAKLTGSDLTSTKLTGSNLTDDAKNSASSGNDSQQHDTDTEKNLRAAAKPNATAQYEKATASSRRSGQNKTASTKSRKHIIAAKARARKRTLRKAQIRRRQAKRRLALKRAANRKRAARKRKKIAALQRQARKRQAAKRKKMAAAKKKATTKRRLLLTRTQENNKKKRARTAFALRSKNKKKTRKKVIVNKKSAAINYAFPAKSIQGKSKYIKNSCSNCSSQFKLPHHLREYY